MSSQITGPVHPSSRSQARVVKTLGRIFVIGIRDSAVLPLRDQATSDASIYLQCFKLMAREWNYDGFPNLFFCHCLTGSLFPGIRQDLLYTLHNALAKDMTHNMIRSVTSSPGHPVDFITHQFPGKFGCPMHACNAIL